MVYLQSISANANLRINPKITFIQPDAVKVTGEWGIAVMVIGDWVV
ncbi:MULTISPECIES: hypothetical protein [unclassified Nostoc]|nr:hypothetical protein [Nostoc sp. JL33]MBN3873762.1 hypothetical protein [Nostoc sp. JL33]